MATEHDTEAWCQKLLVDGGGSAFPIAMETDDAVIQAIGLSKRDYFAARFAIELLRGHSKDPDDIAEQAYAYADGMLKARKQKGPTDAG